MSEIGKRMRSVREQRGMTLEDVGRKAGMNRQTLSRYETGIIENIPSDKLERIAKALHVAPSYLMGWDDEPVEEPSFLTGISPDAEISEVLEFLANRPEGKMLFSVTKNATTEEILQAVRIIEALKKPTE